MSNTKLVKVRSLKGAIEHGDTYIAKKGGEGSFPPDIAQSLVEQGKAELVQSKGSKKPSTTIPPALT